MQLEKKCICPIYREPCKQLDCAWFTQLRGSNPQTGDPVDEWSCAVAWIPMLLTENSKETRQTAAAVESIRNEMVRANALHLQLLAYTEQKLIGGKSCG